MEHGNVTTIKSKAKSFRFSFFIRLLFILSGGALTGLLSLEFGSKGFLIGVPSLELELDPMTYIVVVIAGIILSLFILSFLVFHNGILERMYNDSNKIIAVISAIATLGLVSIYSQDFIEFYHTLMEIPSEFFFNLIVLVICVLSVFALFSFLYAFYCYIWNYIKHLDFSGNRIDKYYLIIVGALFALAIIVVYLHTNVFSFSQTSDGTSALTDAIYGTDSHMLLLQNAFLSPYSYENDIRQFLFGVFSAPFAILAYVLSKILFFLPNGYAICLSIIQGVLILLFIVMLVRLLKVKGMTKIFILAIFTLTYPTFCFSLCIEQYAFAQFYLILFLYNYFNRREESRYLSYTAATGALSTSGILFFLIPRRRGFINWMKEIGYAFLSFCSVFVIFGKLSYLFDMSEDVRFLMQFTGPTLTFQDKLLQFFNFIPTCLIGPDTVVAIGGYGTEICQVAPVTALNLLGVILLILVVVGFLINYKNAYARICAFWVAFSFVLMCIIGWGASEQTSFFLYSLYFSWAYVSLLILLVQKLLAKWKRARYTVYSISIGLLAIINIPAIYDVICFGIQYYPAR